MRTKTRRSLRSVLIVLLCLLTVAAGLYIFDATVDRSGWQERDGNFFYRDFHGRRVTGWLDTGDGRYYLGDDSFRVTGWQEIDGSTYWFSPDGAMATGWQEIGGERCYFDSRGRQQTGWLELEEGRYYLSPGAVTGWQQIDGKRYWFGADGMMATGWLILDETYYLDAEGVPLTGKAELDGTDYYFLEDGSQFHGWIDLDDGRYYYDGSGAMATGWQELNGKRFHFDADGRLTTGWLQDGEYRYYITADDGMVTGTREIDGETCWFTPDGIYVLLVNRNYPVGASYEPELVPLDGRFQISPACLEALEKMLSDCRDAGFIYNINNTYRSYAEQKDVLKTRIDRYKQEDPELSDADATVKALREVAPPGTSEHQTGLCLDINGDGVESVPWLLEHCWEYGFILRFPQGKRDITGIVYESWHFRYVGTKVSIPMRDNGLCLEEYLGAA